MAVRAGTARRAAAVVLLVVALVSAVAAPPVAASFARGRSAALPISSAVLQPASSPAATTGCDATGTFKAKATVTWTATPSAFAAGYRVERWRGTTLESTRSITPRTTTQATYTGLSTGTTYTWRIQAVVASWTSTVVSAAATTPSLCG